MTHIHIHAAGLTRRQIAQAPIPGLWSRLLARLGAPAPAPGGSSDPPGPSRRAQGPDGRDRGLPLPPQPR